MSTATKRTSAEALFALVAAGSSRMRERRIFFRIAASIALCASVGACSRAKATPTTDAGNVASSLAIKQPDGTPVPPAFGYGTPIAVEVFNTATNEPATDATWTATGDCSLDDASGANPVVQPIGFGNCTLTAAAQGMKATATFKIVIVTSVKIAGDTSSFLIGEVRTFTVTVAGPTPDAAGAVVQWDSENPAGQTSPAFDVEHAGNSFTVKAIAVGDLSLTARAGQGLAQLSCAAVASSIQITASSTHVRSGAAMSINAKTFGPGGVPCGVVGLTDVHVTDVACLGGIGGGSLEADGSLTFMLSAGEDDCPSVTVVDGATVSNAISFIVEKVASVVIQGPADPVIVGSTVTLRAVPLDAAGVPFDGLSAGWTDASGIYMFTVTGTLEIQARIAKPGTATIVATVNGIQSPPFVSRAVPYGLRLNSLTPGSIAVGAQTTVTVTIAAVSGDPVFDVTVAPLSVAANDPTKVSFDQGTASGSDIFGTDFTFVGTGLAATGPGGVAVTATWTDGTSTLVSGSMSLVVTTP